MSRRLPVRQGMPDLVNREVGRVSKSVDGRVRKFVSVYEDILKKRQFESNNTNSYFSVFGPLKKTLDLSSPVKCVDNGQLSNT